MDNQQVETKTEPGKSPDVSERAEFPKMRSREEPSVVRSATTASLDRDVAINMQQVETKTEAGKLVDGPEPVKSVKPSKEHNIVRSSLDGNVAIDIEQVRTKTDAGKSIDGPEPSSRLWAFTLQGAALAATLALGAYLGLQWSSAATAEDNAPPEWARAATTTINSTQGGIVSLAKDVRVIKSSIDTLSQSLAQDQARAASHEKLVVKTLEGLSRTNGTLVAKLEENGSKDARVGEASVREPTAPPMPEPASSSASPPNKDISSDLRMATALAVLVEPAEKPARRNLSRIGGWVLRDVYNGKALVETPQQVLHEVTPGKTLPGIGRVEAVRRDGKVWMVVTEKGVIIHDGTP
jgi:hypothetical protein